MRLVRDLPADFPAPIAVVLHIPADAPSMLADILRRKGPLQAQMAANGDPFEAGTIYVARPDHHLLVRGNGKLTLHVARGPRENRHRPSVDSLFQSAALAARENAIGVILSGALDDGTSGLMAIRQCGGTTVVQKPSDALYPAMPQSAIDHVDVDHIVPLAELGRLLDRLVRETPLQPGAAPATLRLETSMAGHDALRTGWR